LAAARFSVFGSNQPPLVHRAIAPPHPLKPSLPRPNRVPSIERIGPLCCVGHIRAPAARVLVLAPNSPARPRVGERAAPLPPPLYHSPMSATSLHHPTPPIYTARPKPSHHGSVSGFWPKPHLPPHVGECTAPLPLPPHPCPPPLCITPQCHFTQHVRN